MKQKNSKKDRYQNKETGQENKRIETKYKPRKHLEKRQ